MVHIHYHYTVTAKKVSWIVPQALVKQVSRTSSEDPPLMGTVLEILADCVVQELGTGFDHPPLSFAGVLDAYRKMDTVVALAQHFHG